jgi:Aldehyde dehydrogenase family
MMTTHHTDAAASADAAGSSFRSSRRPKLERDLFIGNQWRPSSTGYSLSPVNPATGQPFGRAAAGSAEDVDAAVKAARAAFDTGPGRSCPWRSGRRPCCGSPMRPDTRRRHDRPARVRTGHAAPASVEARPSPG